MPRDRRRARATRDAVRAARWRGEPLPTGSDARWRASYRAICDPKESPGRRIAADAEAPNVVATLDGIAAGRHVVFNAHMDRMEAGDEAAWSVPLVSSTRRATGACTGSGMGNMKRCAGGDVCRSRRAQSARLAWAGRRSLTAVSDEVMFGDRGTVFLLRRRPDLAGDFLRSVVKGRGSWAWRRRRKVCCG